MTSGKFLPLLVLGGSLLVQGHKSRPPPRPLPTPHLSKGLKAAEERATRLLGGRLFQAEGTRECLADIEELA